MNWRAIPAQKLRLQGFARLAMFRKKSPLQCLIYCTDSPGQ
jgi:hypothetical protein